MSMAAKEDSGAAGPAEFRCLLAYGMSSFEQYLSSSLSLTFYWSVTMKFFLLPSRLASGDVLELLIFFFPCFPRWLYSSTSESGDWDLLPLLKLSFRVLTTVRLNSSSFFIELLNRFFSLFFLGFLTPSIRMS